MTWCLNEYSDIFRCLLCWTVLPNVIFFLFTRAFQRIGSINCIYQQPSFQGGSVVFSHVQSEQRTNFGCLPPAKNRTFHQAQRQVRRKEISRKKYDFFNKGIGTFFWHPPTDHCHIRHIPTQPDMFEVDDFVFPVSPRFRRGFRCHPVSQRAGVLRSALLAAPFHWTKNMGKTSWETPLLCLECWVYFQYIQIYPRTVFGQAFLLMATPLATFGSERLLRYWKVLEVFARLESSSKYDSRIPEGNDCIVFSCK